MKILLAIAATSAFHKFVRKSLRVQAQFSREFDRVEKLLVTDAPCDGWPFQQRVCNPWREGVFCLSHCRNVAVEHAAENGCDWVIHTDADGVLVRAPSVFPESGFASVNIFRHIAPQPLRDFAFGNKHQWSVMGWFLVARRHFHRGFCEEFIGYGYEEDDFKTNVMRGVQMQKTDAQMIHLHHPMRIDRVCNHDLFGRRKAA